MSSVSCGRALFPLEQLVYGAAFAGSQSLKQSTPVGLSSQVYYVVSWIKIKKISNSFESLTNIASSAF